MRLNDKNRIYRAFCIVVVFAGMLCGCNSSGWRARLDSRLAEYGHRNWIAVVDSAYPKQSAAGIETVVTGQGHLKVLKVVLEAIEEKGEE